MDLNVYQEKCPEPSCGSVSIRPLSVLERLENQQKDLEARLSRVNAAITALKANPETMHVIECISRV